MARLRVLELGNYVVPAYGGMILAEQGHVVTKWVNGRDPILGLNRGADLWAWINHGKQLAERHPQSLAESWGGWDIVLDNFRPQTLAGWGVDPAALADRHGCVWVSMRDEMGGRSFDLIAQARSWMEYAPWVPFWAGDTAGGLWLAFKALAAWAARSVGHHVLGQASCLQKLVEGELVVDRPPHPVGRIPWETDPYHFDPVTGDAVVHYKGDEQREPVRDRTWKLRHLWHRDGRMRV